MKTIFNNHSREESFTIELEEDLIRKLESRAAEHKMSMSDLLSQAVSKLPAGTPDLEGINSKKEALGQELDQLIGEHLRLSSKLSALRFKLHSTFSACATESIRLLALEAEHKSLCESLGLIHDSSSHRRAKELFEKYHQNMRTHVEKGY